MKTNTVHSERKDYEVTLIDSGHLPRRLATELRYFEGELRRVWSNLKQDPVGFSQALAFDCVAALKRSLSAPHISVGILTAFLVLTLIPLAVHVVERRAGSPPHITASSEEVAPDFVTLDLKRMNDADSGVGKRGKGRVGFAHDKGEGSSPEQKRARGGGSGGLHDPFPAQAGKPPQPSPVAAEIPKLPPINNPALPAGIDIDPALWQDIKLPVYGDPRSSSQIPSNGPGDGGGVGTKQGTGIGDGSGPGVGPGQDGNIGGGPRSDGSHGTGSGSGNRPFAQDPVLKVSEVEQRARLISKPEPHYTEEARKNQITGTVVLRVVFSSSGEVSNIHAVSSLPFGLTERAIAAARQIRFQPATRGGRPVSVYMQLEYNFNLY